MSGAYFKELRFLATDTGTAITGTARKRLRWPAPLTGVFWVCFIEELRGAVGKPRLATCYSMFSSTPAIIAAS